MFRWTLILLLTVAAICGYRNNVPVDNIEVVSAADDDATPEMQCSLPTAAQHLVAFPTQHDDDHHKHHKHHKRIRVSVSFSINIAPPLLMLPVRQAAFARKQRLGCPPDKYTYHFYKEINPPPPKATC
ncbi:MAG: hypothetical protein EBZ77_11385 [Chitinophagia bacterium]|nr:hypothetical protein [Chitinophagia bacterium]